MSHNSENLHSLLVLAEEYSAASCLDGEPSAPLKSTPTAQAYLCSDKTTAFSRLSRYGMTLEHLTESRGEELLTLFLEGFRARTSAQPEKAQESTASEADYGEKWRGSLAKYDRASRSWKTRQCSLLAGLDEFSETWPRWGMMQDGELFPLKIPVLHTTENEFGLLPTPVTVDSGSYFNRSASKNATIRPTLGAMAKFNMWPTARSKAQNANGQGIHGSGGVDLQTAIGGKLNPTWVEWLMGWPLGWTELKPLEMGKFLTAWLLHGKS